MKSKIKYVIFTAMLLVIGWLIMVSISIQKLLDSERERSADYHSQLTKLQFEQPDLNSERLFKIVNDWRKENGYKPFMENYALCGLAELRAKQVYDIFTHDWLNNDKSKWTYMRFNHLGENLIKNHGDEMTTFQGWLDSPEHKENIVDPEYTDSCIRCYRTGCV